MIKTPVCPTIPTETSKSDGLEPDTICSPRATRLGFAQGSPVVPDRTEPEAELQWPDWPLADAERKPGDAKPLEHCPKTQGLLSGGTPSNGQSPHNTQAFLKLLEESNLLDFDQLQQARAMANDCQRFAKRLIGARLLTDWQSSRLIEGSTSFHLSGYKLLRLLHHGRMGDLFLGEHVTMKRLAVIKMLCHRVSNDANMSERFLAEMRAIASLDHPNLVRTYDFDKAADRWCLAMEYVDGKDLRTIVRKQGPLKYNEAGECIRQAAEALHCIHTHGHVFRNIRPSHLMLNQQGVVKLIGFGVGRLTGEENEHNPTDLDLAYSAPEQPTETSCPNYRADIYSLGCTFYFLLSGKQPLQDESLEERLRRLHLALPERIRRLAPQLPEQLVGICRQMMAERPESRFSSAREVVRAMQSLPVPAKSRPVTDLPTWGTQ